MKGDYSKMGDWAKEMKELAPKVKQTMAMDDGGGKLDMEAKKKSKSREHNEPKMYFYYPTACPKCSTKYRDKLPSSSRICLKSKASSNIQRNISGSSLAT